MNIIRYNSPKPPIEVVLPVGAVSIFAGSTQPDGWLFCDGSAVSREDYPELFSAIGDAYGPGDGATTFNLPNLKSNVPVGRDSADTDFSTLGSVGGTKQESITTDQMPSHSHTTPSHSHSFSDSDSVSFTFLKYAGSQLRLQPRSADGWTGFSMDTDSDTVNISGTTGGAAPTTDATGGGEPHNNMPPYIVMNYIIKAVPELAAA